jgi:hypothetical protein
MDEFSVLCCKQVSSVSRPVTRYEGTKQMQVITQQKWYPQQKQKNEQYSHPPSSFFGFSKLPYISKLFYQRKPEDKNMRFLYTEIRTINECFSLNKPLQITMAG